MDLHLALTPVTSLHYYTRLQVDSDLALTPVTGLHCCTYLQLASVVVYLHTADLSSHH